MRTLIVTHARHILKDVPTYLVLFLTALFSAEASSPGGRNIGNETKGFGYAVKLVFIFFEGSIMDKTSNN